MTLSSGEKEFAILQRSRVYDRTQRTAGIIAQWPVVQYSTSTAPCTEFISPGARQKITRVRDTGASYTRNRKATTRTGIAPPSSGSTGPSLQKRKLRHEREGNRSSASLVACASRVSTTNHTHNREVKRLKRLSAHRACALLR